MKGCISEKWVPVPRKSTKSSSEYYSPCGAIKDQIGRSIVKPDRKSTQALTINRLSPTLISLYTWADISPWSAFSSRIAGISRPVSILSRPPRSILGRSSVGRRSNSSEDQLACFSNENANISIYRRTFSILVQLDATITRLFVIDRSLIYISDDIDRRSHGAVFYVDAHQLYL